VDAPGFKVLRQRTLEPVFFSEDLRSENFRNSSNTSFHDLKE
jgi:hypothetical protein